MRKIILILLIIFIAFSDVSAQVFGGFPPSLRWKQIDTDTVRVIFAAPIRQQAEQVVNIINNIMAAETSPLGDRLSKVNVVLHQYTTRANGYVALAPFRSEFFLIPPGNIFQFGNVPWHHLLAVHEYRHVQQFNNFNRGLSRVAGVFLGQEGRALANAMAVPDWFWEGDAVYAETIFTPQGRGRNPYFHNGFNALWQEGRNYSWMKLRNGSLKDFVPNHYQLGFHLVNYGYLKYGDEFWKNVTQDASAFRSLIYPFQQSVRRHSGIPFRQFRKEAIEHFSNEISRGEDTIAKPKTVINYHFPQFISDDSLLYLKEGYAHIPAFYIRDSRGEHKISNSYITSERWFSYRNCIIAYTDYTPHARWSLKDFSNIVLLDIHTKQNRRITTGERYYTPDISPSGENIVAVHINDSATSALHLLNNNGEVLRTIKPVGGSLFVQPRFIDDTTVVVTERLRNSMMVLSRINLVTGDRESLIRATPATIGFPYVADGVVYFVSSVAANDDIYALRLDDKSVIKMTSGNTGNYYPSAYKGRITWSTFTTGGFTIQERMGRANAGSDVAANLWAEQKIPFEVASVDTADNVLVPISQRHEVSDYKQGAHLLNVHSWRPDYEFPYLSMSFYSDNILNNFSNELFYRYNTNEKSHGVGLNTAYAALFPVLTAGTQYTFNRTLRVQDRVFEFDQIEARAGFYIPINFTGGKTYKSTAFGSNYVYSYLIPKGATRDQVITKSTPYFSHFINWRQQLPQARQHIYPRFGYAFTVQHRHRINERGYLFLTSGETYLPSFRNHSFVLQGSFQQTDTNNVLFANRFFASRGYPDLFFSKMWRLSANYAFPLAYPDWGFGNIVYFYRIRPNLFYDFSRMFSRDRARIREQRSIGTEIFFDTNWWNSLPVSFGVRYSYLLDAAAFGVSNPHVFELILPVGLIPR